MDATLAIRPIRTTLTNGEGRVTNSLKCAEKEPPVSTAVIVAAVIAAIPTLGIGALLVWGIRHYYLACKAEERQREQAEFACGVIFEKIQSSDNGDRSITISLSTGYKVVCTQKGGNGLWISTNGGKETTHPDLLTIEDLKNFFINDIKENIDFYVEKNPKNSLIALFSGAINNENNKDELDDLIRLIERVDRSADHNLLEKFQEMFSKLETYIEKICSGFKDKLRVKIVPGNEREDGFTFNVTFNDFCIASPLFRAEKPLRDANESFITLLTNARANGTEAALINSIEAMDAFARANKFNEFQKSICSLKSWIERNDTDFKGKLRVEVTEIRGKSTFAVKLGDLCIAKPAFYNNRLDGDLFQFEADVYDEDGVKLHTILSPQSVEGLLSEVTSSPDSLLFEVNSSRLSHFLKKMDENSEGLKLKVETKQEHSTVTLILPGNDERHQVNFEGNLKLNDRLFSKVNEEDV
ncbi:MAG: hypothetical protein K0R08_2344, partial [Solimicrobium sp.]|nr:hypothetical protein [Solimicrobium sp.]